ncbi:MAG: hypothetical protein U0270_23980 [Labilithrix sp.]
MRAFITVFVVAVVCFSLAACGVAEIPGSGATLTDKKGTSKTTAKVEACQAGTERAQPEKLDPASLKSCECRAGGKARCAPKSKLPATLANHLDDCDQGTGACVPDKQIANGGAPLTECKSAGKAGRCLSLCLPEVASNVQYLTRGDGDACDEDERCIPCVDPLTGDATGICDLDTTVGSTNECLPTGTAKAGSAIDAKAGETVTCPFDPAKNTPGDVNRFPSCGPSGSGGRCLENSLVPSDIATRLGSCEAEGGKPGLCVPEVYVKEKGKHLPTTCSSFAGIEGRCFSTVFKDVDQQKDILQQDACAADERCLPCFNPANGQPTGACKTVECDAPKKAAVALEACCKKAGDTRGKCVPKKDIPANYQPRLKNWECDRATELCVPDDNIDINAKAVPCDADGDAGVCVSDCVNIGFFEGLLIDRGSCRADQQCVPCVHPLSGKPTGAPGCANTK